MGAVGTFGGMRMGKHIRRIIETTDDFGEREGRPPCMAELRALLPDMPRQRLEEGLSALERGGYFVKVARGCPIPVRTAEGKRIVWRREVVDE